MATKKTHPTTAPEDVGPLVLGPRSAKGVAMRFLKMALLELEDPTLSSARMRARLLADEDHDDATDRSKRTFERDRAFVREHFLASVRSAIEEARMMPEEALIHRLVQQHLDLLLPPAVAKELAPKRRAAREILERGGDYREGRWKSRVATLSPDALHASPRVAQSVLDAASDSLFRGRQLQVTYRKAGASESTVRILNPLGMVLRFPVLYLIAATTDHEAPHWYALHRMEEARVVDMPCSEPSGFDLSRFLAEDPGSGQNLGRITLELDVDEAIVHYLTERPFPGQTLSPADEDGWCRLTVETTWSDQLVAWIRSWGPALHVAGPRALRTQIKRDLASAQSWYG